MVNTLKGRLTVLFLGAIVIVSGGTAYTEHLIHEARLRDAALERTRLLTRHTLEIMYQGMRHGSRQTVDAVLASVSQHNGLDRLRVISPDGVIRYSSFPGEIDAELPVDKRLFEARGPSVQLNRGRDRVLAVIHEPIQNTERCKACHAGKPETMGLFQVQLDTTEAARTLEANWWALVSVLAFAQVVVFGLLWLLTNAFLEGPAQRLLASMRRVAAGRLDERVALESPTEFAAVGAEFNAMVEKLEHTRNQLDLYYQHNLERADRLATVGEMATAMAHEIQNPLAGLSGALQVMAKDARFESRHDILVEMLHTIDRLSKSVRDLLDYARPSRPSLEDVDLNHIARSVALLMRQQLGPGSKVHLVEDLEGESLPAWADPQQLRQVLLNLTLNGVQAMPEGGTLTIKTARNGGDFAFIRVRDTGVGISKENLEKVFRPFFTTKPKGTGLGLAICKGIVERGGGRISVEAAPGGGTIVHIALPLTAAAGAGEQEELPLSAAGGG